MRRRILGFLAACLMASACTVFVPLSAYRAAAANQRHINRVRLGQTLAEVEKIMTKGPERRSTRLRYDGLSIEEWSYVTDYVHHSDTTITFVGGKVDEIRVVPWEGERD
ncbi:MAG TPA: hypothetical protein VJZ76_16385 [Thermoanaerobaculia bacterium]|nr:hypothetical protein [Thermoanaerobaculia bacterium]